MPLVKNEPPKEFNGKVVLLGTTKCILFRNKLHIPLEKHWSELVNLEKGDTFAVYTTREKSMTKLILHEVAVPNSIIGNLMINIKKILISLKNMALDEGEEK